MFSTKAIPLRALSRAPRQARCPAMRRLYATQHEQRTQETLKTSSRLTWLTTTAALGAAALYYTTSTTSSSPAPVETSNTSHPAPHLKAATAPAAPKPVEDRFGDSVEKHGIAAHKNQNKVREGKFSGKEFDNHVQTHSPGKPGGDFETR
ncbi:hypothetical protein CC86DRAFT_371099 [Ophiobolus disseminans]|uniref:Uncharacterized protein n=1 Tax=Ophiobolus disseminans TaxID=1469910 RepID=A0A6A6ZYN4_9PLEO|nr:hypothetical protein CC86DRAFT_371099 [Ophiobolus disseminans]